MISDSIIYIGADDKDIDLFESQFIVPEGISYNSYVIKDEKIVIMDTIDKRKSKEWQSNLNKCLGEIAPDYLVISHLEPDHAYNIGYLVEKYPNMQLVGNAKTFDMLKQFFDFDIENRQVIVKENDTLNIGKHTLRFIMAPMVHWPEVMFTYEETEKVLFSADAFGKFGALDVEADWACEARRYYFNIVGKYGMQVQAVLKKLSGVDVKTICPLHGPVLKDNLSYYIEKYDIWSSYKPEDEGTFIAYASIHGNTKLVAEKLAELLKEKGEKVAIADLSRTDFAENVEDAFRYDKLVVAASSYNMGVFPPMEHFLLHLKGKNYQNRKVAFIENGSWAPSAGKTMKEIVSTMKDIDIVEPMVTIKSTMKDDDLAKLNELATNILKK
ncbi:MAG: FprA family A-type flavoprotein [Clostridia bacterium]|nr:FprA family A-type flavoprotein [Clostridia bacterium]